MVTGKIAVAHADLTPPIGVDSGLSVLALGGDFFVETDELKFFAGFSLKFGDIERLQTRLGQFYEGAERTLENGSWLGLCVAVPMTRSFWTWSEIMVANLTQSGRRVVAQSGDLATFRPSVVVRSAVLATTNRGLCPRIGGVAFVVRCRRPIPLHASLVHGGRVILTRPL